VKDKNVKDFSLGTGNTNFFEPDNPGISIVCQGKGTYLWVGNNSGAMWCFGLMSGTKRLSKLAHAILRAIGEEPHPLTKALEKDLEEAKKEKHEKSV